MQQLSRNQEILSNITGPTVLHVGCADHVVREKSEYWLHKKIVEKFPNTFGLDLSEKNIEIMKGLGYKNLFVGNAETFSLDSKFDTIVAGELIEHLSNPGLFFLKAKVHLKPGGRLIITTPYPFAMFNVLYSLKKFPKTCQNTEHTMWFCISTLRSLFSRYGYEEINFSLIQDYELDNLSISYRLFAYAIAYLGFLIPKPIKCNSMIFVLKLKGD